ncbi:uncharacterized protein LY79DRAFT_346976 [Colletotrichum navitas]|uniref:Uncharacterized protein n=1 Tax=Colletotrichum navitas TaxID=681940 RepID=A0AAD8PS18_9PEZI|nr:uncharacterized protein LY79DRAFT_346976 [Colletotrichum navitas]KAK1579192.1 hypothetical protein LY79DRAFT_346976 [Colletotrichum navitas]
MQSTNTAHICTTRGACLNAAMTGPLIQASSLLARAPCAGEHSSIVRWSLRARAGQCPSLVVVLRGGGRARGTRKMAMTWTCAKGEEREREREREMDWGLREWARKKVLVRGTAMKLGGVSQPVPWTRRRIQKYESLIRMTFGKALRKDVSGIL